jgi:hypothetical protein
MCAHRERATGAFLDAPREDGSGGLPPREHRHRVIGTQTDGG